MLQAVVRDEVDPFLELLFFLELFLQATDLFIERFIFRLLAVRLLVRFRCASGRQIRVHGELEIPRFVRALFAEQKIVGETVYGFYCDLERVFQSGFV